MLNGLITILAVLAGGVLTYLVQARLDSRRAERERQRDEAAAEREREREQAAADAEMRVATRLLLEELDTIALHHALVAKATIYPRNPPQFPTAVWERYKTTFAGRLDDETWQALATFMHTVPQVRTALAEAQTMSTIDPSMEERLRDGALLARDLHATLSGTPAPSVNEKGEPE
jgi:hypothetical protein